MFDLLARWPVVRQILNGGNGTGAESMSEATHSLRPRHEGADVTRSVCPYCAVGCGQLIFHRKGRVDCRRRRPAVTDLRGSSVSQGGRHIRAADPRGPCNAREVSGAQCYGLAGSRARDRGWT